METSNLSLKRKGIELSSAGDASKISGKLHHGLKEIRKAAKKAKMFETQRLVKKLKDLRAKGADNVDIQEYEAQLSILKDIDHEIFASTATKTKIMKDHVLFHHQQVQDYLSQELGNTLLSTTIQDKSTTKVHSRLLSSKVLAMEISSFCGDLRELLGREPKKSRFENNSADTLEVKDLSLGGVGTSKTTHMDANFNANSQDEGEKISDETGWESGTVDEEEDHDQEFSDEGETNKGTMEDSENGYDRDEGPEPLAKMQPKLTKQSDTRSTFLPSLSVGFVEGSENSDWSDNEAKIADSSKKKNRRGQRARRAIWEKKYGQNANHKKKELGGRQRYPHDAAGPNKRNTAHRGPLPLERMNSVKDRDKQPRQHEPGPLHSGGSHQREPIKSNEKPLHPSWEAKRKLKEKQSASILPSQGTKITFSDK